MALRGNELAHSFGTAATEYDRLRSSPPALAVDWLVGDGITNAVELGAGTGKFSRMLAERVPELYPIEPDARMRDVFANSCPGLSARAGSAEEIPLPDASVDFWTRRLYETDRVGKAWIVDNQSLQGLVARALSDPAPGLAWALPAAAIALTGR